jgi:hypothetical protein
MGNYQTKEATRKAMNSILSTSAGVSSESTEVEATVEVNSESTNLASDPAPVLSAGLPDSPAPDTTNYVTPVEIPVVTPKKKGRPKVTRETKQRYAITLLPSLYAKAGEKAAEQGRSLSEVIGRYLEAYIKED